MKSEAIIGNDPSAGSPTETLLRLLLPLDERVCASFPPERPKPRKIQAIQASPESSPIHPIGSSDGRCVQRAGT